jgi:hypothetical protein
MNKQFAFRRLRGLIVFSVIALMLALGSCGGSDTAETRLSVAEISSVNEVGLRFLGLPEDISDWEFSIEPDIEVVSVERNRNAVILTGAADFQLNVQYTVSAFDPGTDFSASVVAKADDLEDLLFNEMYSDKTMGTAWKTAPMHSGFLFPGARPLNC